MTPMLFLDFDGPLVNLLSDDAALTLSKQIVGLAVRLLPNVDQKMIQPSPRYLDVWRAIRDAAQPHHDHLRGLDRRIHGTIEQHEVAFARQAPLDQIARDILLIARRVGYRTAIVSNNSHAAIKTWLVQNGAHNMIDVISARVVSTGLNLLKPDAFLLRQAIGAHLIDRSHSLFIGDSCADYQASGQLQIRFLGLQTRHSLGAKNLLDYPSIWRFTDRSEIPRYLASTTLV